MKTLLVVGALAGMIAWAAHRAGAAAQPMYVVINGQQCPSANPIPANPYGCGAQITVMLTLNSDGTVSWSQPW